MHLVDRAFIQTQSNLHCNQSTHFTGSWIPYGIEPTITLVFLAPALLYKLQECLTDNRYEEEKKKSLKETNLEHLNPNEKEEVLKCRVFR